MAQYGNTGQFYDTSINNKTHEKVAKF